MITIVLFLCVSLYCTPSQCANVKDLVEAQQDKFYNQKSGLWDAPTGWWNSANALEAIVEYMLYSKDHSYLDTVQNVFQKTTIPQTLNDYFDDQQWWGLAWLKAYQLTNNRDYLDRSVIVWNHVMTNAWDNHCGGGVWWSTAKNYKNAITNELFLTLSMGLYNVDKNSTYLNWAIKEWRWFEGTRMLNSQNLINDGLTADCKNNNGIVWTYNQGVILGGLGQLAIATNNNTMLQIGQNISDATLRTLVYPNGVLQEPCERTGCDQDSVQFKGIFVRYLGIFSSLFPKSDPKRNAYFKWLQLNQNSILGMDTSTDNLCGYKWVGPAASPFYASIQTTAIDCCNAVTLLN